MENPGIDPGTSRMLSGRSTTWANSPTLVTSSGHFFNFGPQFSYLILRRPDRYHSWNLAFLGTFSHGWDLVYKYNKGDGPCFFHSAIKSTFLVRKGLSCLYNEQCNTWLLVDMEVLFSWSTRCLTRSLCSQVSYRVEHSKRTPISTRIHLLYELECFTEN